MKKSTLAILLLTISQITNANLTKNIDLVSFANYNMPAISVKSNGNHKIVVLIKAAILEYPTHRPMLDQNLHQKLQDKFSMKQVNALILTFDEHSCRQNKTNKNIFSCGSIYNGLNSNVLIQGAVINYQNEILNVSSNSILEKGIQIETVFLQTVTVDNFSVSSHTATLEIESLDLVITKENLN